MSAGQIISVGLHPTRTTHLREGKLRFRTTHGVRGAQALLIDAFPAKPPASALVGRDPEGILALAAGTLWPGARIRDHHFDAWVGRAARTNLDDHGLDAVEVLVTPDLPEGPFALAALPFPKGEDALLGRELVEQAHDRLEAGGRFLASTDSAHHWLQKVVKEVFGEADIQVLDRRRGAVIAARRKRPESRARDHAHRLRFERGGRELSILTRPGIFSHGRLDDGTKALLAAFRASPGERVLDLGCGAGALGLAAAADAGPAGVVLVDSSARAVACAEANARENGLEGVTVLLRADLEDLPDGPYGLVLANPPYFSKGRIADAFARAAAAHMSADSRLLLVTKAVGFHRPLLERRFADVHVDAEGEYGILTARRPR